MKILDVPFEVTDWENVNREVYPGETGESFWKVFEKGNVRVRIVEYSADFKADHWCSRGHVLHVLSGELTIQLKDNREYKLEAGMGFQAEDDEHNPHLVRSGKGAVVFIVD